MGFLTYFFKSVQIFCRFFLADFSSLISLNYVKNPCLNQLLGKGMTHEDLTQIQIYGQHILKCMGILRGEKKLNKIGCFWKQLCSWLWLGKRQCLQQIFGLEERIYNYMMGIMV